MATLRCGVTAALSAQGLRPRDAPRVRIAFPHEPVSPIDVVSRELWKDIVIRSQSEEETSYRAVIVVLLDAANNTRYMQLRNTVGEADLALALQTLVEAEMATVGPAEITATAAQLMGIGEGDEVEVPDPDPRLGDAWHYAFTGSVAGLRDGGTLATVRDAEDDAFDIEVWRLKPAGGPLVVYLPDTAPRECSSRQGEVGVGAEYPAYQVELRILDVPAMETGDTAAVVYGSSPEAALGNAESLVAWRGWRLVEGLDHNLTIEALLAMECEELGDFVHDIVSQTGSEINNAGREAQLNCILGLESPR